ncbi:MAG: Ig-like domain repeat protein [Armatimonadetes bacterium]|nr:Ig-like domain repeat protein [Armatimonadota bacterium]
MKHFLKYRLFALLALLTLFAQTGAGAQVKAWGANYLGHLGDGTTTDRNAPITVSGLTGITQVQGGEAGSLVLKSDGTVWAWGWNGYGQVGDGTNTDRHTPVQVSGLTGVTQVAGTGLHSLALKSDGTVWAWGYNALGQLGDGTTDNANTPVQVSGLTGITQIAGGSNHSLALKSDGTVWAWGYNGSGQLGNGTTDDAATPVQVSGLTGVTQVAASGEYNLALKSDGTVRAWGNNGAGQLGDGTNTQRRAPVQVSGLTGVTQIAGGGNHSLALKSDGAVWAWGNNLYGQLGDGTSNNVSNTPLQVSGLTGITQVAGGYFHSLAVKSDGAVWAWGRNDDHGQLGDGTNTNRTTPVQVSGLTGATQVAAGFAHSLALTPPATPTRLDVVSGSANYGQTVTLTARLRKVPSLDGIAGKVITFSIDGNTVGTGAANVNGFAQFAMRVNESLAIGNHTIGASFAGDVSYLACTGSGTLTVAASTTTLAGTSATGLPGQTLTLSARLKRTTDLDGVSGKVITFTLDGNTLGTATTNATGYATYNYVVQELSIGNHALGYSFAGTSQYGSSSASGTLTLSKENTSLAATDYSAQPGQSLGLRARLKRPTDGAGVVGRTVAFTLDGSALGTATTDATGIATYNYTVTELSVGNHTLGYSFAGDASYNSSNTTSALTISKENTSLPTDDITGATPASVNLTARLKGSTGIYVAGRTVTFKVDGTTVGTATTDANGLASLSYSTSALAAGAHRIATSFAGDASYNASTGGATLTLKVLTLLSGNLVTSPALGLTAYLRTAAGAPLAGRTVHYSVVILPFFIEVLRGDLPTTNSGGVALGYYGVEAPSGSYRVTLWFDGDASNNGSSTAFDFNL